MHEEKDTKQKAPEDMDPGARAKYLLDRELQQRAKILSNTIKEKRKEKAVSILKINLFIICSLIILFLLKFT